jgi:hypothetical protein
MITLQDRLRVKIACDHLRIEVRQQAYAQGWPTHPGELRALLEAMTAREDHMVAVALESATPDELRAALIADGTLPAGYVEP